jgi:RsiW-degrading membrane proteinase PrsW (M82 family)
MPGFTQIIIVLLLSVLPCALWLWYFSSRSLYKRPARRVLGLTFALGALATVPALFLNLAGQSLFIDLFGHTERWSSISTLIDAKNSTSRSTG